MNDIFESIYQRYALFIGASDAFTLTGGRMFRTIAKEKAERPYIVVSLIGGAPLRMFGLRQIEQASVQFMVVDDFDGDARNAGNIWNSLISIFEYQTLVFMDGTFMVMKRDTLPREVIETDVVEISGDFTLEQQTP